MSQNHATIAIPIVVSLLLVGIPYPFPFSQAQESALGRVPEPWIDENHEYDTLHKVGDGGYYVNEGWEIRIAHGVARMSICVRNLVNYGDSPDNYFVDYSVNIEYDIGGEHYVTQFYINELEFDVGGYTIGPMLTSCSDFTLSWTPIVYDGTVPTFDCNITLYDIEVYSNSQVPFDTSSSTFDFTLIHHIRGDWNDTQMKVEALYDFDDTRFYDPDDGNEYPAGELFTAKLGYRIIVAKCPGDIEPTFMVPTSRTNDTLVFNLTLDDGTPLTASRLEMRDNFTIYNGTGDHDSVGYSYMGDSNVMFTPVTHVFPNLTYLDTQSIKSDPKITIYHDQITDENNQNPFITGGGAPNWGLVVAVWSAIAIGVIGFVGYLRKRRRNSLENGKGVG